MYIDVHRSNSDPVPGQALTDIAPAEESSISAAELDRILREHRRYLSGQRGTRAKLASANLNGMNLRNRDLSEADLSGASLVGANLCGANLAHASLNCADLRHCDLRYAHLESADLRGASLKGANLAYAMMDCADFRAASTMHVGFSPKFKGNAHDAVPFGAVDFSNCSMRKASFRNARLDNADFTDAMLQGAIFKGARLGDPCFRGAILEGVALDEMNVPRKALRDRLPEPTAAARERAGFLATELVAHHEWFVSGGKKGWPVNIDGEDLRPLSECLKGLCLAGLSARNVIAVGVDFSGCRLQAAHFDGSDLRAAKFIEADLSGVSLRRTKLAHTSFLGARIQDLTLCNGQIVLFQADRHQDTVHQFNDAQILAGRLVSGWNVEFGKAA